MNAGERLPGTPAPMQVWRTADGLRVAADSWGVPGAQLVLLGHGGGQTRHAWKATGRQLGEVGYQAVAFDMRGHGDSDWPPDGDYSMDAQVRGLQSLVQVLGAHRKPVLIGASMSAEIFLIAVGECWVDAAALVMVDFAPRTQGEGYERNRAFMAAHTRGFESLEEVADAISSHRGGGGRSVKLDGLAKVVRKGPDGRYYWHWDQRLLDWRVREYPTGRIHELGETAHVNRLSNRPLTQSSRR